MTNVIVCMFLNFLLESGSYHRVMSWYHYGICQWDCIEGWWDLDFDVFSPIHILSHAVIPIPIHFHTDSFPYPLTPVSNHSHAPPPPFQFHAHSFPYPLIPVCIHSHTHSFLHLFTSIPNPFKINAHSYPYLTPIPSLTLTPTPIHTYSHTHWFPYPLIISIPTHFHIHSNIHQLQYLVTYSHTYSSPSTFTSISSHSCLLTPIPIFSYSLTPVCIYSHTHPPTNCHTFSLPFSHWPIPICPLRILSYINVRFVSMWTTRSRYKRAISWFSIEHALSTLCPRPQQTPSQTAFLEVGDIHIYSSAM